MKRKGAHPRRVTRQRLGWRSLHPPARFRRARHRVAADPQHKGRDAGRLRRQCQTAASRQVHERCAPAQFDHQRAQRRAAQRIDRRAQQQRLVLHRPDQQPRRVDPQFHKPRAIGLRPHSLGQPQPKERRRTRRQMRKDQRQARHRPFILVAAEQFVQPPTRQAALKRLVERAMPGRHRRTRLHSRNSFQRCDVLPQGCKRFHRLDHKNVLLMFFSDERRSLSMR